MQHVAIVFPYTLESSRVTITATVSKISLDINVISVKIGQLYVIILRIANLDLLTHYL